MSVYEQCVGVFGAAQVDAWLSSLLEDARASGRTDLHSLRTAQEAKDLIKPFSVAVKAAFDPISLRALRDGDISNKDRDYIQTIRNQGNQIENRHVSFFGEHYHPNQYDAMRRLVISNCAYTKTGAANLLPVPTSDDARIPLEIRELAAWHTRVLQARHLMSAPGVTAPPAPWTLARYLAECDHRFSDLCTKVHTDDALQQYFYARQQYYTSVDASYQYRNAEFNHAAQQIVLALCTEGLIPLIEQHGAAVSNYLGGADQTRWNSEHRLMTQVGVLVGSFETGFLIFLPEDWESHFHSFADENHQAAMWLAVSSAVYDRFPDLKKAVRTADLGIMRLVSQGSDVRLSNLVAHACADGTVNPSDLPLSKLLQQRPAASSAVGAFGEEDRMTGGVSETDFGGFSGLAFRPK